jgi:Peptidase family M23
MKKTILLFIAALLFATPVSATEIATVLAQPIFRQIYSCTEHWQGNLKGLGDELGTDCSIQKLVQANGRTWLRAYAGNGHKNSDWYGWGQDVLSPCSCEVVKISQNPAVNRPGIPGKPPATFLELKREDGVFFLLAHVANIRVTVGEQLRAGQLVGQVGNNGYSRHPHIHIGAWKGEQPALSNADADTAR